jgi:FkbM family methyltransferase
MSFKDMLVIPQHDVIDDTIERLQSSKFPLVMWGSGELAELLYNILLQNHCHIDAVFSDSPQAEFHGFKVVSFDEICGKYEKFNLIIGHSSYHLADRFKMLPDIVGIYSIFDPYHYNLSFDKAFLENNSHILESLYENLADEKSRFILCAYINARLNKNWRYILPYIESRQYFGYDFMRLGEDEVFVDCGAYVGDTLADFLHASNGRYKKYIALEPDISNASVLESYITEHRLKNIFVKKIGAWDQSTTLSFLLDGICSKVMPSESPLKRVTIMADTLDRICGGEATYIKMDIEGAEMNALRGAAETIKKNKPKLAISVYHRKDDLLTIPSLIKSLCNKYVFYFRIHKYIGVDAVLYATCK